MANEAGRNSVRILPVSSRFPDLAALTTGLAALWHDKGTAGGQVRIRRRKPNVYASTFPSEVVTCRLGGGDERKLFCKYGRGPGHSDQGCRGGVCYEAEVYQRVLRSLPLPVPVFHGFLADASAGGPALVLDYLEDSLRISRAPDEGAMSQAAAWAGRFHALQQERLRHNVPSFLARYDADYFAGWSRRLLLCAKARLPRSPWLRTVCRGYEERIPLLTEPPLTVIHGEFTPHNVLWCDGQVVPTDWEAAAVGAGAIDLATLIEGWKEETLCACEKSYRQARWPEGAPRSFAETFGAARLYVAFRWLAVCPEWTVGNGSTPDLNGLHDRAERMGLI